MVSIYSVIIQTKETVETFSTYRSLFADAIHRGQVGFCTWNKQGRNIDEALPDIRELTDDKKEWTAVIVCSDPANAKEAQYGVKNPYDFFTDNPEDPLEESTNPLIRLTHMLGGLPPLEKEFRDVLIEEPFKQPRIVYEPVEDKEREAAYNALREKYDYDGVLPSSIVLLTIRMPWINGEDIAESWKNHAESASSEFWKRNRYPSSCRFMVFDFVKQGPVRREADMFRFWLAVVLFSTNKIDSSSLQAYRLYSVDTLLDLDQMEATFQIAVNRICSARESIRGELRMERRKSLEPEGELPDYHIDVPVNFELPKNSRRRIKHNLFKMISRNLNSDLGKWDYEKKLTEDTFIKSVRIADRALDQTANRMKVNYTFDESEVMRIDKYQREDLELESDMIYKDIIDIQGGLPTSKMSTDEETEAKAEKVRNYMKGRITTKPVILTFVLGSVLILLAQIPVVAQYVFGEPISWLYVGLEVLTFIVVLLISGLITLFFQKKHLDMLIGEYNRKITNAFDKLNDNAGEYSRYLSAIASHSRARSYLDISQKKGQMVHSARVMRYKHLSAIELFLSRLHTWAEAFHLDVDFQKPEINDEVRVDIMIPPVENYLYSLETGSKYEIEVNKSGMKINTPFAFISKLELIREELYDDDNI